VDHIAEFVQSPLVSDIHVAVTSVWPKTAPAPNALQAAKTKTPRRRR
jgi:hypothetical protein